MASAYRRPPCGLEGAGDGGRLCPSKSTCGKAFFKTLVCPVPVVLELPGTLGAPEPDADIAAGWGGMKKEGDGGREGVGEEMQNPPVNTTEGE